MKNLSLEEETWERGRTHTDWGNSETIHFKSELAECTTVSNISLVYTIAYMGRSPTETVLWPSSTRTFKPREPCQQFLPVSFSFAPVINGVVVTMPPP